MRAIVLAFCLYLWLLLVGAGPVALPESVQPCAPCHNSVGRDQVAEWLLSPYSEEKGGRGCTDCHDGGCSGNGEGPTDAVDRTIYRSRDSKQAVRLAVTATCSHDGILAEIAVTNVGVGHLMPTGSSERTLLLEVSAHGRRSVISQPRLRPFATAVSRHRFELPSSEPAEVSAQLFYVPSTGTRRRIASAETVCPLDDTDP